MIQQQIPKRLPQSANAFRPSPENNETEFLLVGQHGVSEKREHQLGVAPQRVCYSTTRFGSIGDGFQERYTAQLAESKPGVPQ